MVENRRNNSMKPSMSVLMLLGVICFCITSFAEDARTSALGGISILNGFSHILYNPASMNDFPDQIMGTTGSYVDTSGIDIQYFGPFIAKKSIGKNLSIGCIANTIGLNGSSILRSKFYEHAHVFLDPDSTSPLPLSFPMIPHLIIGYNLNSVSVAAEGYIEPSHFKKSIMGTDKYSEKGIYNVGGKLNANISVGQFWFCPLVGFGVPSISGGSKDSTLTTYGSNNSNSTVLGTEIGMDLSPSTVVAGIYRTSEHYQFTKDAFISPEYQSDFWDLYAGYTATLLTDVTLACQYDVTIEHDKIIYANPQDSLNIDGLYTYHAFHVGVEKPFCKAWIFDAVIPRAGMVYTINDYNEQVADTLTQYALSGTAAVLNAGIGFKKNIFCLDLFVNLGNWNGVLTGPKAVAATLTIGLSNDFLKSKASEVTGE